MSDLVGRTLGPYLLTKELGHGGMANVYLASQTSVGREVAVKVLPSHFLQDRTFLDRFTREVRLIARLQHPRILPIYDFGEQDGVPYIVMAYMTGGTLSDLIYNSRGGMGLDETARLIGQAAEGLDYAHEQGIIHRDFKPSNVLLDAKGNAHLADFGIAKATADTAQITGSGFVGTPAYAAPEMSQPEGLSPSVDVYALGVTLYQMLTGKLPYDAETPIGVLMAHMSRPIPDVLTARNDLPNAVREVIENALAKIPEQRYQSAGDLADDLRRALGGAPAKTRPSAASAERTEIDQHRPDALTEPDQTPAQFNTTPMTVPAAPATREPAAFTQVAKPTKRGSSGIALPLLIGGGLVALLAVVGLVALVLSMLSNGEQTNSSEESNESSEATPFVASGGGSDLEFPLSERATFNGLEGAVYSIGFSQDASRMVVGEITRLSVWDVAAGDMLFEMPTGGVDGNINEAAFSPDGRYVMATIGFCVNVYDVQTGEYSDISDNYCDIGPKMYTFDFSPDGKLMAGGSGGSVIGMYDLVAEQMVWSGEEHEGDIHAVAFTPDGTGVASASADAQIIMWETEGGESLWSIDVDVENVWDMDISPTDSQGAATASNGTILLFDPYTGEELRYLEGNGGVPHSIAYSPNGALLAIGTATGDILIYDADTAELLSEWHPHSGIVTHLVWLSDSVLVSSSEDGTIKFWE